MIRDSRAEANEYSSGPAMIAALRVAASEAMATPGVRMQALPAKRASAAAIPKFSEKDGRTKIEAFARSCAF